MSSTGVPAEFPHTEGIPPAPPKSWGERLIWVWFICPRRSSSASGWSSRRSRPHGAASGRTDGNEFVWLDNYKEIFTDDRLVTAIRNNAIWVAIVPASVTALGLVFAVLVERIRWSTAFKIGVFMPLAISLFAVGHHVADHVPQDPDVGAINAGLNAVRGVFVSSGVLADARPSTRRA